jgi:hypothetical protein
MKNRNIPACNAVALRAGTFTTTLLALGFLTLSPIAQAVSPPPDGGYPGQNTAEGQSALLHLAGGTYNTALGWASLGFNVTGNFNTAVGAGTLLSNTSDQNTATGAGALLSNTGGSVNTANGVFALFSNAIGSSNTAVGANALFSNTQGGGNTAVGLHALENNITGNLNTAVGYEAGLSATGSNNVYIGAGIEGLAGDNGVCRIGSIYGESITNGSQIFINAENRLGTSTSSKRFKQNITPTSRASEVLYELKPVTFQYKKEIDPEGRWQFGLVAEDVEKVNPDLVVRDKEGKPYSVRYDQVNAMLLNEFLKEHKKVQEQQTTIGQLKSNAANQEVTISELKSDLQTVVARLKDQDSKIQRVSAELEIMKRLPQVVAANP